MTPLTQNTTTPTPDVLAFTYGLRWSDVPGPVRERLALLALDAVAAARAGRDLEAARIASSYAALAMPGTVATRLATGGTASATGAAFANGTLMNAIDYDDGHAHAKGHAGATVWAAALAVAEHIDATHEEFLLAALIGYEVALHAAVQQHSRWPLFHSSGTWGALGAAAAAGRLLRLDPVQLDQAFGLAEYHAPVDLIMRAVAEPTMAKDAMGWGAHVGVSSAQLASSGFTGHRSEFIAGRPAEARLGHRWEILQTYVKAYPCCRWAHPALEAAKVALHMLGRERIRPDECRVVRIITFSAAAELSRVVPRTSEQAQFNLVWPVARALVSGGFDLTAHSVGLADPDAAVLVPRIEVVVAPELDAAFPGTRRSAIELELTDGTHIRTPMQTARGDADDPGWADVVLEKHSAPNRRIRAEPKAATVRALMARNPLAPLLYGLTTAPAHADDEPKRQQRTP